ncbi:NfeD family protein [Paenibacillus rigui]|uniref:Protease n=1 Tax=Paenibacillus rigui TaxID=554312 RepID=A0A229UWI4_9BACL|nr:NfeD family protein [Paenibacillus rigui]OXM87784.1 protease [Paenibacillus rigui]
MLDLYWGLLITGVLFAVVTVIFGDLLSNALDGLFDFMSGEHLHMLQPMVLFSGITVCGGAGIVMTRYSSWGNAGILLASLVCALAVSILVYFVYVKPMERSENSVAFSMQDLVGTIAEVITPIPAGGYGEVLVRMGAGHTNQIAASFEGKAIQAGTKVVTVEVKDGTLYVACFDKEEDSVNR